jgi:hypothetical protein
MYVRRLLPIVVLPLLVAALPADAAPKPKPQCSAVTDPSGDAGLFSDGSLDITGGDMAVGSRELAAVLRVAGRQVGAPLPAEWRLAWSGNGVRYEFRRSTSADGGTQHTSVTVGGQQVAHKFAVIGTALVWRFDRKVAPALRKPRIVWQDGTARTSVAGVAVDTATSPRCA